MCEHYPGDGDESRCIVCRPANWSAIDREHRDHQRRYARTVAAVCLAGFVVAVAVALACGVVNVLSSWK